MYAWKKYAGQRHSEERERQREGEEDERMSEKEE